MERKVKVAMPPGGNLVDGFDVPIGETTERWTELKLEDGSVLRLKPTVVAAVRVPDHYDQEGNPMYALKATITMVVAEAPEYLKRGHSAQAKPQ